ncbi:hypothetical protein PMI07_004665 [Rhizobium sp. CF080]|nr:hypothetical protein PMI07_004665 [Rhizobium sp. CF080]
MTELLITLMNAPRYGSSSVRPSRPPTDTFSD